MGETWYEAEMMKPELNEELLAHYGVKGMKWRHRKGRKRYTSKSRSKAKKMTIPGSNIGNGIWNMIEAYERWQDDTKWGRFLDKLQNTKLTDIFTKDGTSEANEEEPDIYWQAGPDGKWHKYKNGKRVD